MKRLAIRTIVAGVALVAAAACAGDPTADLRTGPSILSLNPSLMFIDEGTTRGFEVVVRDRQLNPVPATVTTTSTNPNVFTVVPDTTVPSADGTRFNFVVTAVATGQARLAVSGGGLADTATISVLPVAFPGTGSSPTPVVGQPFTFHITNSLFSFNIAKSDVDFGDGIKGEIIRRTTDSLTVRVPQPDAAQPAELTVEGIAVSYVTGLTLPLPTATTFDVVPVGDRETPGAVVITPPASGAADLVFWDGFKSGANGTTSFIDYYYQYTLAAPDTLTFTLSWNTAADLDMINLRSNFTVIGGFGAATGANPQTYTVIFPAAGTYHLLIESFDDADEPAHLFKVTIHNP